MSEQDITRNRPQNIKWGTLLILGQHYSVLAQSSGYHKASNFCLLTRRKIYTQTLTNDIVFPVSEKCNFFIFETCNFYFDYVLCQLSHKGKLTGCKIERSILITFRFR